MYYLLHNIMLSSVKDYTWMLKCVILCKRNLGKVKDEKELVIHAKGDRHYR